ncbi:unconventional myosin-XVI-like isoform X1 [Asterias rubens]|uniref:unconventional myosin-XVI-like isoform X1 n=2 Tax=Asterias rubens TaxID=7604 RepID=UPI001454FDC4|nr:unconventional myosin-XVI-like isoform X1 [Asterias rubens]
MARMRQMLFESMTREILLANTSSKTMEIDQSTFDAMPRTQRLKLAKKVRQEQLRKYYARERENQNKENEDQPRSPNKKGTRVNFGLAYQLRDAITRFDVREVLALLSQGADPNTSSESGVTVLHQCCLDDNLAAAEILVSRGANVNAQDDDWWSPLHASCACDYSEITQLLLNNHADVTLLDIDGNVPLDHATEGSEARLVMEQYMEQVGMDYSTLKGVKHREADRMLSDVKEFLLTGGNVNTANDRNTSLLHIAAANNYREVAKYLLDRNAEIDIMDDELMTPLHIAARFGHTKMVKLLTRRNANPKIANINEETPQDIAATELIQQMLKTAMQEYLPNRIKPVSPNDEEIYEELPESKGVVRINSKNLRARSSSLSKTEEIFEAQTRLPDDEKRSSRDIEESINSPDLKVPKEEDTVYLPRTSSTDDLTSMSELSQNMILQELMLRYTKDVIYTYVGDILISVNPFKSLPIYSNQVARQYSDLADRSSLTPHIFCIADRAYRAMLREGQSQCCIISGESGAGKTESAKYFVKHILMTAQSEESLLNDKIQQVNPLLECFGNAQTEMNDNSSRFGKYLELLFSSDGHVQGASISEYLLEKSRVIAQGERERNFHIFYLMYGGLSDEEKMEYGLSNPESHRYLNQGHDVRKAVNTASRQKFQSVRDCFRHIGFSKDDEDSVYRTLAAVLHLGDLKFTQSDTDMARLVNQEVLERVSVLLQVSSDELGGAIMSETTYTRGEAITKVRTVEQAEECRDALAKAIYSRLFSWVVNNINQLLQPVEESESAYEIGVLDIFGFENFNKNSFEQICINLANEQFQNFFNEHVFLKEQDDCEREGIALDKINFTNNKPCLDLFLERHTGIIALIDEESHFPRGTNKSMATKLHSGLSAKAKNVYFAPKDGGLTFGVLHYAGMVHYDLNGILEKNRDTLAKSVHFTMKTSYSSLIREMFQSKVTRTGSIAPSIRQRATRKSRKQSVKNTNDAFEFFRKKRMSERESLRRHKLERPVLGTERKGAATVLFHFKNSLAELINKMMHSSPHFIRCIKPNTAKLPDKFTPEYVIAQLRYTGVMETTRIRQSGFPLRLTPEEFIKRYGALVEFSTDRKSGAGDLQKCKDALKHHNVTDWKLGKSSKFFFRHWHAEKLGEISRVLEGKIVTCQKVVRGFLSRQGMKSFFGHWNRQKECVANFLNEISAKGDAVLEVLESCNDHDETTLVVKGLYDIAASGENKEGGTVEERSDENVSTDSNYAHMEGNVRLSGVISELSYECMTGNGYSNQDMYVSKPELDRRQSTLPYQLTADQIKANKNILSSSLTQADEEPTPKEADNVFDEPIYELHLGPDASINIGGATQHLEEPSPRSGSLSMNSSPFQPGGDMFPPPPPPPPPSQNGFVQGDSEDTYVPMGDLPPPPPMEIAHDLEVANIPSDFPPPPPMSDVSEETKQNIANIRARFLQEEKHGSEVTVDQKKRWSAADEPEGVAKKERIAAFKAQFESAEKRQSSPEKTRSRPLSDIHDQYPPSRMQEEVAAVKRRPPAPTRDPHTRLTMGTEQMVAYHEQKQRCMSSAETSSTQYPVSQPSNYPRRYSDTQGIPPPPDMPAPPPPQESLYGNVSEPLYGNVKQAQQVVVQHTPQAVQLAPQAVQQPIYGNLPETSPNQAPHNNAHRNSNVPYSLYKDSSSPPSVSHQPQSNHFQQQQQQQQQHHQQQHHQQQQRQQQQLYGNLQQPDPSLNELYANIPPPPTEAPPPIPSNASNVFTRIPGVVKASKSSVPPPPMLDNAGAAPPPPPGPAPPPPPGPAPPPPSGLPVAPFAPPPPPSPSAPMGGSSGHGGGLLDGIMNVQLSSVAPDTERKRKKSEAPMDDLVAELLSGAHRLRPTPKPVKGPGTEGQVADPDEQAKIINKRQPPPVSPTKPSKTPPNPALKSPGPKTQAKPIPFVAPKPKTKSTSSDDYLGVIPPPPSVTAGMCVTARPTANHPPAHQGVATKPGVIPPPAHQGAASSNGVGQGASPPQEDDLPPWKKAMRDKKLKEQQQKEAEEAMKKQQEDAKWKDIPEWKKKMIMEKERKKAEEAQAAVDHDKEEREAKIKAMPTWKRNLVKKKSTSDETNNNGM